MNLSFHPILLVFLVLIAVSLRHAEEDSREPITRSSGTCDCQCNPQRDSSILVDLYWATGGPNWTQSWDPTLPYLQWENGNSILNIVNGCVFELELQQNNLRGELPESIGELCQLKELSLYENGEFLTGQIPTTIGNLCNLEQLNLNGNNFTGTVPVEITNCTQLRKLYLSDNSFSGFFPDVSSLDLQALDISNNLFHGLPSLQAIDSWGSQPFEGCKVYSNLLSFDDIIPNMSIGDIDVQWVFNPQKKLYKDTTIILHEGQSTTLRMDFDSIVSPANTYQWFKDGALYLVLNDNRIPFSEVTEEDEGNYHCKITNAATVPGLTLETYTIQLRVCQATSYNLKDTICSGQIKVIDGMEFNMAGEYQIDLKNSEGCDSTLFLELSVLDGTVLGFADAGIDQLVCEDNITLNGVFPEEPYSFSGRWTALSSGSATSPEQAWNPPLVPGENIFLWTLSADQCPDYDTDTVLVWRSPMVIALNDTVFYAGSDTELEVQILENDMLPADVNWKVELDVAATPFNPRYEEEGFISFSIPRFASGQLSFGYKLCNEDCDDCTTAEVFILPTDANLNEVLGFIPEAITPNGDGINDYFIIPPLEYQPDLYPNNELIVQNRRGVTVFYARPYNNDWQGTAQNGMPLPTDNYRYLLKLDDKNIKRGNLLIITER